MNLDEIRISPLKMAKSQKTAKVHKNRKNQNFEKNKKPSRGIASMNICTKFGEDWVIFRYRNWYTFEALHNHRMTEWQNDKHFFQWSFHGPEGSKRTQKNFQANLRKKHMEVGIPSSLSVFLRLVSTFFYVRFEPPGPWNDH